MHSWNLVIIPGIMRTSGARQATHVSKMDQDVPFWDRLRSAACGIIAAKVKQKQIYDRVITGDIRADWASI